MEEMALVGLLERVILCRYRALRLVKTTKQRPSVLQFYTPTLTPTNCLLVYA